ncbi:MAG: AAA family ATPase [Candidatus Lokiarchaeota archaeon]|nr:AAA family ATPase [Candidatus Lokiarchaeota archaeon]
MQLEVPCFLMICSQLTEKECIEKNLFGDYENRFFALKSINKGDVGFLLNVSQNKLLGIFIAEGPAKLNIEPKAWNGKFAAQVKVKLVGNKPQEIFKASEKLEKFIKLKEKKKEGYPTKIPYQNTYGPEITEKLLSLFEVTKFSKVFQPYPKEIGIFPEINLEDVAGLDEVKNFIYQRIIAPFEDEEKAYSLGLRIGGGMLLFGLPGTGKTLIAMTIAKSIQAKFIDISPSIIIGYPGEAEKRLENIFRTIEKEPRAVVFLDEAEWILCKREVQTSSVMQRITPVLLAQLSQLFKQRTKSIIVIATTNKPEMIDTAFLRPGRFDKIFYIGLPDKKAREKIIKIQTQKRFHKLTNNEIEDLSQKLEGYSGADIENIIEESAFLAFTRRKEDNSAISKKDVDKIIEQIKPSVTFDERQKVEKWAKERGIKSI